VSHVSQSFGVLLVRSAESSEPVVDRLPTLADAEAAVPRWKIIYDSPQAEYEQDQADYHCDDYPHLIFNVALSGGMIGAAFFAVHRAKVTIVILVIRPSCDDHATEHDQEPAAGSQTRT
jgi:hypothetical protein